MTARYPIPYIASTKHGRLIAFEIHCQNCGALRRVAKARLLSITRSRAAPDEEMTGL